MPRDRERTTAWIGVGANLGDREAQIRAALAALDRTPGVRVARVSGLRETEPVGGPPQGPDLNGVAEVETELSATVLLGVMQQLEREAGRARSAVRNEPRPLDLDLLAYGDDVIDTRDLVVPHPRVHERSFVLDPLAELGVDLTAWPRVERPAIDRTAAAIAERHAAWRRGGCRVGLVPTMGALHAGHATLLQRAREDCDRVTATIFVNPLQFDQRGDLEAYPRDLDRDLAVCRDAGVDAVFAPDVGAMYSEGFASRIAVGAEAVGMEGASRAGHFEGVATVVAKLLSTAPSDCAYFGEKDAQQLAVITRVVEDLGIPTEVRRCPIIRDADGLALSSRNQRLGPLDRHAAVALSRALSTAQATFRAGERSCLALLDRAREVLSAEPRCALEYLELRHERDLAPFADDTISDAGGRLLVAATLDGDSACATRLIDNVSLAGYE